MSGDSASGPAVDASGSAQADEPPQPSRWQAWMGRLRELYLGSGRHSVRFRYALLAVDVAMIVFVVISSFFHGHALVGTLDLLFGVLILADFTARMLISRARLENLLHPTGIADLIVIVSLLAPVLGENLALLRVVRTLRLLRSYQLVSRLGRDFPYIERNRDVVFSVVNLAMFILVMTAVVFETQVGHNPEIQNYADALYFTVATLTTTGFGDVTLQGTGGRLLAVLIMIFGVSLFIRLVQTVFRPARMSHDCPKCGLSRHDPDAVHCKHCGEVIKIPTEGMV